jgi:thioredoxin-like negative regulator of GroEL
MLKSGVFDEFSFSKVDFDKQPEIASKLMKGSGVPQLVLYRKVEGGWVRTVLKGYQSVDDVKQFIKEKEDN